MSKPGFFISVFLIMLVACSSSPSESAIQTAIAQTLTANPTAATNNTPIPPSATPTKLPTATFTPSPTNTPRPTMTPTPTPLPPATQTAQAVIAERTRIAQNATATRQVIISQRTATAVARSIRATEMAQYEEIYWKELASYPNQHIGEKVKIRGRVFNIVSSDELQMYFAGTYEAFYVKMRNSFSGIYENDIITVYGVVAGVECFENVYGAKICQPLIDDAFWER